MILIKLDDSNRAHLLKHYRTKQHKFPLIIAVLNGIQEGFVFTNKDQTNFFIQHKFGFSDLIETEENINFDSELYHFLIEKNFHTQKIRWYNVSAKWMNKFQQQQFNHIQFAERVQMQRDTFSIASYTLADKTLSEVEITADNFDEIETAFDLSLSKRFWSSKQQFIENALGIVVYKNGSPAAICYACAQVDGIAEIDVFTHATFRKNGLGSLAVAKFINKCIEKSIKVHWDCYTNNMPSFLLAKSFCFEPYHIYSHAIISK